MEVSTGQKRRKPWPTGQLHFLDRRIFECIVQHVQCRYARMALALTCKQCYGAIYTEELRKWWFGVRGIDHEDFRTASEDEPFVGPMADMVRNMFSNLLAQRESARVSVGVPGEHYQDRSKCDPSFPMNACYESRAPRQTSSIVKANGYVGYMIHINDSFRSLLQDVQIGHMNFSDLHRLTCGEKNCSDGMHPWPPEVHGFRWNVSVDFHRQKLYLTKLKIYFG